MFENLDLESLKEQGFIGAIASDSTGAVIESTSDDIEVFGGILGYITQVADMIGEPFGMDSIEEIQMVSANTTAVCLPQEGDNLGVLCNSRTNIDNILNQIIA